MEQSDLLVVTKHDGDLQPAAKRVAYEYMSALKYLRSPSSNWKAKVWCGRSDVIVSNTVSLLQVKLCSAVSGEGVEEVWSTMERFRSVMEESGELAARRREQHLRWMWSYVEERLVRMAREAGAGDGDVAQLETLVREGEVSPGAAADSVIQMMMQKIQSGQLS